MPALGRRPDAPVLPYHKYRLAHRLLNNVPAPVEVDCSDLVQIIDQQGIGSCVLNAIAQVIRAQQIVQGAVDPEFLSRLFGYWLARKKVEEQDIDIGTELVTGFSVIAQMGFCPESSWPYVDDGAKFRCPPRTQAFVDAFDQKGRIDVNYHRITTVGPGRVEAIRQALGQRRLVAFGTLVSDRFCGNDLGVGPITPPIGESVAGGHAMTICGSTLEGARVANSWSRNWGDSGFCWLSWDYITWSQTDDFWIVDLAIPYSRIA